MWGAAITLALGITGSASAEGDLSGKWTASPLTSKWVIGDWGTSCGPKPGGGNAAGASVSIAQTGRELIITGGGRSYSTTACWEEYPGLRVVSHSAGANSWKTTCKTLPSDPRQATITTSLTATSQQITFYEAGQYQFVIQGQNCTASVGRYRTYTLVPPAAEAPAPLSSGTPSATAKELPKPLTTQELPKPLTTQEPKKAEAAVNRCSEVGPANRLEVRPAKKLMRPGEEFTFRASVMDAKGCTVRAPVAWTATAGGEHAEIANGTVTVKEDAPESVIELAASINGRSAKVTVEVASKERYEALLASNEFDSSGEVKEAATVAVATRTVSSKSAVAEDRAADRKAAFVAIVGLVAVGLGIAGALVLRKGRKSQSPDAPRKDTTAGPTVQAPAPAPMPVPVPAAPEPQPVKAPGICPVCGKQYPPESRFCGADGATLVPLN